jgi:hypothetical protein
MGSHESRAAMKHCPAMGPRVAVECVDQIAAGIKDIVFETRRSTLFSLTRSHATMAYWTALNSILIQLKGLIKRNGLPAADDPQFATCFHGLVHNLKTTRPSPTLVLKVPALLAT